MDVWDVGMQKGREERRKGYSEGRSSKYIHTYTHTYYISGNAIRPSIGTWLLYLL